MKKNSDSILKICILLILGVLFPGCDTDPVSTHDSVTPGGTDSGTVYSIDHNSPAADSIPAEMITAIKSLGVYFEHASVGGNIVSGLDAMAAANAARYWVPKGSWSADTGTISSSTISWYNSNSGFGDNNRSNPGFSAKISRFDSRIRTAGFAGAIDVASFKFCYIDNNYTGTAQLFFDSVKTVMEGLEAQYPGVKFFWWTMPLTTTGDLMTNNYNTLVRNYCSANNRYLLDIADIESHAPDGMKQTDGNGEKLYSGYTSDGGHLNAAGSLKVAKAYWVILARICGWTGN